MKRIKQEIKQCTLYTTATILAICLLGGMAQAQLSTLCRFTSGPLAGTTVDYAPLPPLPSGSPCWDGALSHGVIIAIPWKIARISPSDLPQDPGGQNTPVTCWAASIAYIFAYYNHDVLQNLISARYYPVPHPGDPKSMTAALNTIWTDSNNQTFAVHSQVTDEFFHTAFEVSNEDVVDAITNDTPVFYGTSDHAMVLLAVRYRNTPSGVMIADGEAWDPNPIYHGPGQNGIRTVQGSDIHAMFVAIPTIAVTP